MYALVCLSILASAVAAPHYHWPPPPHHHHNHHHDYDSGLDEFIGDGVFDTGRFFSQFTSEMNKFEQMMREFAKHFPASESTYGIDGNQYKINVVLNGFEEKEITVKARDGLFMVQAVHKAEDGSERNYLDIRTLPFNVKADSGSWTYEQNVLKIVFPLKETVTTEASGTTENESETPESDREEIESQEGDNNNEDADVGIRGDTEIITNEIPQGKPTEAAETVETTTYAVDFNNDVEFVPVQMKQVASLN